MHHLTLTFPVGVTTLAGPILINGGRHGVITGTAVDADQHDVLNLCAGDTGRKDRPAGPAHERTRIGGVPAKED